MSTCAIGSMYNIVYSSGIQDDISFIIEDDTFEINHFMESGGSAYNA